MIAITVGAIALVITLGKGFGMGIVGTSWLIALHNAPPAAGWVLLARARLPHRRVGLMIAGGGMVLAIIAAIGGGDL